MYAAESGGKQLVENNKATFDSAAGQAVANFWATMYADKLAPQEAYTGDSFADQKAAMAIVGPWAIPQYQGKINWGVVPVPTSSGMPLSAIHTSRTPRTSPSTRVQEPGNRLGPVEVLTAWPRMAPF